MTATGADVLELDHEVEIETACRILGPTTAIWGNLDPVSVFAQEPHVKVRRAVARTLTLPPGVRA